MQELGSGPLIVSVARTPDIYEHYLTVRMRKHFSETGWELRQTSRMEYLFAGSSERHSGRVLSFTRDGYTLRLFVQPIIGGGGAEPHDTGCGLYRNNSLRMSGTPVSDPRSTYYMPDFALLLTGHGEEKHMIMDAKFPKWSSVQYNAADLVFRYLVSLTPYNPDASVHGLTVFCGKGEATPRVHSFYDLAQNGHSPELKASWLYLIERDSPDAQCAKLTEVFRGFLLDTAS